MADSVSEIRLQIKQGAFTLVDGVISKQSQELIRKFDCHSADMNEWWQLTPVDWVCPTCKRSKSEIARKNKNGALMCHLVEHHDHVADSLRKTFEIFCKKAKGKFRATPDCDKFVKRVAPALAAFDNIVMCVDCNNADSSAKKLVGAPKEFSFSPVEIAKFIQAAPNLPHKIDKDAAQVCWAEAKNAFLLRQKLIRHLAEVAAQNDHWFQPAPSIITADHVRKTGESIMQYYDLYKIRDTLIPPKKDSLRGTDLWRRKRYPRAKVPSEKDIEYVKRVSDNYQWNRVDAHWRCPICCRSKIEIIRKNNKNQWMLDIAKESFLGYTDPIFACGDCVWVARQLGIEAKQKTSWDGMGLAQFVSVDELKQIIIARPHCRHDIRNEGISEILNAVAARMTRDSKR
ncbi:hypothetical protein D6779_02840 [Candidatus Parcubacteria bacterium]|nr:MAG: hypothetical protein D6779_02840 [Candidatus Parcubacteria bacterium]